MAKFKKNNILIRRIILPIILLSPVAILLVFSFMWTKKQETENLYAQKRSIAYLANIIVKDNLDKLVDLCDVVAARPKIIELTNAGKWDQLPGYLYDVPKRFAYIDALFIADKDGTLKTGVPGFGEIIGKNFAFRDWYRGVGKNWRTYVSEVYKRANQPQHNVIAIAAPIRTQDGLDVAGILVFQVRLDIFGEWEKKINLGKGGLVYITDQRGKIIYHPKYPPQDAIVDFSAVPTVQKLLKKESGIGIIYNPIEKSRRLTAYEPIGNYGWGIAVAQPVEFAFASRDIELKLLFLIYVLIGSLVLILFYFINRNISIIRESEKTLRHANAYNRSLIEASLDPLVTIGPDGKITDVNMATEKATGCLRGELIGKDFSDYFTEPEKAREGYREVFYNGFVRDYPLEIKHKDGHFTPVLYNASVYKDEKGLVIGVFAAARDITERKETEEALKESEMRFKTIFNESTDGMLLVTGGTRKFFMCNPMICKMLGYSEEEISRLRIDDIHPENDLPFVIELFERIVKGELKSVTDLPMKRKDGSIFYADLTTSLFTLSGGKYILGSFRDVTNRKKMEDELKEKMRDLEDFSKFAVARELRMEELEDKIKELEGKINRA